MITVTNLTKRFGRLTAVDDVTFEVPGSQAVALWGPNGAGKTTILRCLLGLLRCRGTISLAGLDIRRAGKSARSQVGYVPQELAFHDDFKAAEAIHFFARLRGVRRDRVEHLLSEVGLEAKARRRIRELSGGMKQRLALALALVGDPPILLLDEPTSNLDQAARRSFLELLDRLKTGGKTILFTSHRLDELELLADRVLVLDAGRLALDAPPSELARRIDLRCVLKLIVDGPIIDEALEILRLERYKVTRNGRGLLVEVAAKDKAGPIRTLMDRNIDVRDFELSDEPMPGSGEMTMSDPSSATASGSTPALASRAAFSPAVVAILARKEIREALRNRWFVLYTLAFAALTLALSTLSMAGTGSSGFAGFGRTAASLINLVMLFVPLMALTAGATSIAGERERGTLAYLLAQPITRLELLTGKLVGLSAALLAALAIGFGISAACMARGQHADAAQFGRLFGLAAALAVAMVALGILVSICLRKASAATGVVIVMWLGLVFAGDLGLMGSTMVLDLEVAQLFQLSLINPLQVFKMAALGSIHASLDVLGPAGLYATQTFGSALPWVFGGVLAAWIAVPAALSAAIFSVRGVA